MIHTPPVPYFGAKRAAAPIVWTALGDPGVYLEPFAGSLAVLLARPTEPFAEVAVDSDGLILNWWRCVKYDHEALLGLDGGPVAEVDIEAWHARLALHRDGLTRSLASDPRYRDLDLGLMWWAGQSSWLGSGWAGEPRLLPSGERRPVARQRPHIDRTLKGLYAAGCTDERIARIAARLANVVLLSGDWTEAWRRCLTDSILRRFARQGVGVFLDPPYSHDTGRAHGLYTDDAPLSAAVERWCLEVGPHPEVRIVLAGYATEYEALLGAGWSVRRWGNHNGYAGAANTRREADVLICSPSCAPYCDRVY